MSYLREFHETGRTVIVVTHDPAVEAQAGRRVQLRAGEIVSVG